MTSPTSTDKHAGHLAIAALALAMSWWLPNHHWPWADFYSDAWASLVLGVVAAAVFWKYRTAGKLEWHALSMVTLACCGVVGLQYLAGLIESFGTAWISALYLLGLAMALMAGAAWERSKPGECANFVFLAVLIGALGSILVQFQQWLQLDAGDAYWLFLPSPGRRFHANLGQPNQLATLICLGILACAWLHERRHLPAGIAWILAALLAIGLALTESRTSWVVVFLSLAALLLWRRRLDIDTKFLVSAAAWATFFVICVFALPLINVWLGRTPELQEVRGLLGGEMRLDIWREVWNALLQKPWLGYGWMQTSLTQFPADPYNVAAGDSLRHAHNLFLDLLVYLGLPLGLVVCAALIGWFWKAMLGVRHREQLWMLLFVSALAVHAMLEFPLYYAYFLLPLGLIAGAMDVNLGFKARLQTARWPVATMLVLSAVGWTVTARDYLPIEENFFSLRFEHQRLAQSESKEPSAVVLTQLQDLLWLGRVDPAKAHSDEDVARALRVSKLLPSLVGQYKLAEMYALADKPADAEYWLIATLRANNVKPQAVKELRSQWEAKAAKHPLMAKVKWPN